jgi:hypothetical protein
MPRVCPAVPGVLKGRWWGHFRVKIGHTKHRQGNPTPTKGYNWVGWAENGCLDPPAAQRGEHARCVPCDPRGDSFLGQNCQTSTNTSQKGCAGVDTERVSVGSSGPAGCAVGALCVTWALCSQGGGGVIYGSKWVKPSTGKALPHQTKDVPRLVGQKMGAWGPQHPRGACMEPLGRPMLTGRWWGHFWVKMGQTKHNHGSHTPQD